MEPTSNPDNTRPSPGSGNFWPVRPEPEPEPEPVEPAPPAPADPRYGSPLGTFHSRPIPPLAPIASAVGHPRGAADPFGLNRAGRSVVPQPAADRPENGPHEPRRHGDPDHSVPPEDETEAVQDVKSGAPEGGFGLGRRTGRFLFGKPDGADPEQTGATTAGQPQVGDEPTDEETAAASGDGPAARTPPETGPEAAAVAGPSDENGREDMNGRAGAPGYAQTGEAGPDTPGEPAVEPPAQSPAGPPRAAAGWASVPGLTQPVPAVSGAPVSGGPVPGVPVSPAYTPNSYAVADFTPDHPAGTLRPVSGSPAPAAPQPAGPASATPVSPAQGTPAQGTPAPALVPAPAPVPAPATASASIPATRTPPDLTIDVGDNDRPPATAESGYGFAPTGYSLGRPAEVFGVAAVAAPAPQTGTVAPPSEFRTFPPAPSTHRARTEAPEDTPAPTARRSASLEDAEPIRRPGRRAAPVEELAGEEPLIGRSIWDDEAARHFRTAWHEVKAEFVDDPVTALTRAHDLLTDAVNELTEVLLAERDELDPLRGTDTPDTESMRMAMRGYREFLERILSL